MESETPTIPRIDRQTAKRMAADMVAGITDHSGCDYVVVGNDTIEVPTGWISFHRSKRHVETGDPEYFYAESGPIYITRTGVGNCLPASAPWEECVALLSTSHATIASLWGR